EVIHRLEEGFVEVVSADREIEPARREPVLVQRLRDQDRLAEARTAHHSDDPMRPAGVDPLEQSGSDHEPAIHAPTYEPGRGSVLAILRIRRVRSGLALRRRWLLDGRAHALQRLLHSGAQIGAPVLAGEQSADDEPADRAELLRDGVRLDDERAVAVG